MKPIDYRNVDMIIAICPYCKTESDAELYCDIQDADYWYEDHLFNCEVYKKEVNNE